MGFWNRKSAKNPQSGGADHSFSSSSAQSESQGGESSSLSDVHVPIVNLTEQRLLDWRAGATAPLPGATASGNGVGVGVGGGVGGGGALPTSNGNNNNKGIVTKTSPPRNYTTSPNNLILLIERGQWAQASQRATSHEHEVKQLVKLRKTTKNASGSSSSNTGADGDGAASSPVVQLGVGGRSGGGGGGSNKRNVQISNVKCKALHHACQKLRSVHTTIYQKSSAEYDANDDNSSHANSNSNHNNTRRIIEEDEYVEACKCILTLIRIHPEACKERESRHGCLPLHLCVFSMCATPPPPLTLASSSAGDKSSSENGNGKAKGHHRTNSSSGGSFGRPPVISSRSVSAPPVNPALNLPVQQSNKGKGHRSVPSNSSADFSLGNISQMIQEESEHQQALSNHRENNKNNVDGGEGGGNDNKNAGGTIEENILQNQNDMERLLLGLETKYEMKEDKRRQREKLDRLEERSRETDSHSTPQQQTSSSGGSSPSSRVRDERTGAQVVSLGDSKMPATTTSSHSAGGDNISNNNIINNNSSYNHEAISPALPTYEELQRRYLQINTLRREEYSVRVLNALLDAWPKSVKTSSEGGRLPLHMACFGKATVKAMETILKAYPDAARQRNHDGFLPIHIAAHWGVSHPDIAPLILRAYPDGAVGRNRWERTPIEEALGMAGENGRDHQLSLVWSLRRHPTYWIHNDIAVMLLPRNVRCAPWRMVDAGDYDGLNGNGGGGGLPRGAAEHRRVMSDGSGAVDVDEVGSSDDEDEGFEIQSPVQSMTHSNFDQNDPQYVNALASSTDLSLLITKDKHWAAAAIRCRQHPQEAREAMEVKVRGAYTAKITPLHYACENRPSLDVVKALIDANPHALERRQEPGGQLPLHAACTWGTSPEVIQLLLKARPQCAEMRDFLSNLPLHCACYSGAETVVIEALLRAYPQGVWPRNHQGSGAIDIVRRLGHPNRREVLGLLERTVGRLLERATAANNHRGGGVEGAEGGQQDTMLEWV